MQLARSDVSTLQNIINSSACTAHAAVNPTAMWLLEQYIGCPIHLGHSPVCAIQRPEEPSDDPAANDEKGKGGWHSDYP